MNMHEWINKRQTDLKITLKSFKFQWNNRSWKKNKKKKQFPIVYDVIYAVDLIEFQLIIFCVTEKKTEICWIVKSIYLKLVDPLQRAY